MAEEKTLSKRNKATVPADAMLEFFGAMKHILPSRPLNKFAFCRYAVTSVAAGSNTSRG
jgi:hypothetical protein